TSTCTTRRTTRSTRSIPRRWRRTRRRTRCSRTWRQMPRADSAARRPNPKHADLPVRRGRAALRSARGLQHPDRQRQARRRIEDAMRDRIAEARGAQVVEQGPAEVVEAEHAARCGIAVVFGLAPVDDDAVAAYLGHLHALQRIVV